MFLIFFLLGVKTVAGVSSPLTKTVSPTNKATSLPFLSDASLLVSPVNPKLTLKTMPEKKERLKILSGNPKSFFLPFFATASQFGAIERLASRNSIPMANPKFLVNLSTNSEFSFLTNETADLYTSLSLAPSFKSVKIRSSTDIKRL